VSRPELQQAQAEAPAPLEPASLPAATSLRAAASPPAPLAADKADEADEAHEAHEAVEAVESELRIARLEGRVAALEAALERRSEELRLLQRHLCPLDLAQLARLTAGLPPLPRIACEPGFWRETRELTEAEVPETLDALWSSIHPPGPAGSPARASAAGSGGSAGDARAAAARGVAAP